MLYVQEIVQDKALLRTLFYIFSLVKGVIMVKKKTISIVIMICVILGCIGCSSAPQSNYKFVSEDKLSDGVHDFRVLSVEENMTWFLSDRKNVTEGDFEKLENGRLIQPISYDGEVLLLYPKVEIPMRWQMYLRTDVILPIISKDVPSYMIPQWAGVNEEHIIDNAEFMEDIISLAENAGERIAMDFSAVKYKELWMLCYYDTLPVLRSRITFFKDDERDAIYVEFPAEKAERSGGILITNERLIQKLNALFDQMKQEDVK